MLPGKTSVNRHYLLRRPGVGISGAVQYLPVIADRRPSRMEVNAFCILFKLQRYSMTRSVGDCRSRILFLVLRGAKSDGDRGPGNLARGIACAHTKIDEVRKMDEIALRCDGNWAGQC